MEGPKDKANRRGGKKFNTRYSRKKKAVPASFKKNTDSVADNHKIPLEKDVPMGPSTPSASEVPTEDVPMESPRLSASEKKLGGDKPYFTSENRGYRMISVDVLEEFLNRVHVCKGKK